MSGKKRKLPDSSLIPREPFIIDGIKQTLHTFGANTYKCLLAKKRRVSQFAEGAGEIYRKKLEDACAVEAEKWSEPQQSLWEQLEPVLDDLKQKLPTVGKSQQILLEAVLQRKSLLQEVSNHYAEKIKQLKSMIQQLKQRRDADADHQTKLQKTLSEDFRAELLNLRQEIMLRTQKEEIENITNIMKSTYS